MKERPALFNTEMVCALLDDRKTHTRRTSGLNVINESPGDWRFVGWVGVNDLQAVFRNTDTDKVLSVKSPYGRVGDRLWVRETSMPAIDAGGADYRYAADYDADGRVGMAQLQRWTPSIHMPRWASRITLEITDIRVERLQDISEADAKAEGVILTDYELDNGEAPTTFKHGYELLWNTINGPNSWDANPWVWVIQYKRVGQ